MTDQEIMEMQRRIDEGIQLAHQRLWQRASISHQTLVVNQGGKLQEIVPQQGDFPSTPSWLGDPLYNRCRK